MSAQEEDDKNRPFGKAENIEKRLAGWAHSLSTDTRYPWAGLGLIDDLKQACRMLGGNPDKLEPKSLRVANPKFEPAPEPAALTEYDL